MTSLAAIGLRLHSGWASAVVVAQDSGARPTPDLVARRRIILCEQPQAKQPYHAAENMELEEAEVFLAACRAATIKLAADALKRLGEAASPRKLTGAGLIASSVRAIPPLPTLLHSHMLIHAAEGAFYRQTVIDAAMRLGLKAHATAGRAASDFLDDAGELRETLERIGKMAGPPWTIDEKCACLAALALLPGFSEKFRLPALDQLAS